MLEKIGSLLLMASCLFSGDKEIFLPSKVTLDWEKQVLGFRSKKATLDNAVSEMVDGLIDDTFGKDFTLRIQKEIEEHPNEERIYTEFWENGKIKARLGYKNGRAHGHIHGWYENGKDAFKGFFDEGTKLGTHIVFIKPSKSEFTNIARILRFNKKGELDGNQSLFYPNGGLRVGVDYVDGLVNGEIEIFGKGNNDIASAKYKDGVRYTVSQVINKSSQYIKRPDEEYVNQVVKEFLGIARKKFKVVPYGKGAKMPYDVEEINVAFNVYQKPTTEEARKILVTLKECLAEIVNKHKKLRPYLRDYPFSSNRAKVSLAFCDKNGKDYDDGKTISFVCVGKNNTVFYTASTPVDFMIDIHEEPYDEAVRIVKSKEKVSAMK